jgi:hypothetical protein
MIHGHEDVTTVVIIIYIQRPVMQKKYELNVEEPLSKIQKKTMDHYVAEVKHEIYTTMFEAILYDENLIQKI